MRRTTSTLTGIALAVGVLLVLAVPALAGGGGHGSASCRLTSEGGRLDMLDNCFEGKVHRARVGSTVTVTNRGKLPHTVTAVDGSFDSGVLEPRESFQIQLDELGDLPIYCTLHGTEDGTGMSGVVEVLGADRAQLASGASPADGSSFPTVIVVAAVAGLAAGVLAERRRSLR